VRAAVLRAPGEALALETLEVRPPGPRDVVVRIAASGVCHSDRSIQDGTIPHPFPAVLGHEGAGVVERCGPEVTTLEPGDHVVLTWVAPCRRCFQCLHGHPELCEHGMDHAWAQPYAHDTSGAGVLAAFGTATFGETTVVPEHACVRVDRSFPLELAALVGCGVVTGVGAVLNSARVAPGESVAVVGCGGVGLAAVQGARLAGADPIVAIDRVRAKLDLARACGATHAIEAGAATVDAVREVTGGRGVDHAIEAVGLSGTIRAAYDMARRAGTVTVVGAGRFDDAVSFGAMQLMVDAKTIRGCVYGGTDPARDIPAVLRLHASGRLDLAVLVSRRIGLDDLDDAFRAMDAGEVARSVVVF
jgi:S-(hydroxymethyl)glutathione dehydrogenase/alcohol dehydrogenase